MFFGESGSDAVLIVIGGTTASGKSALAMTLGKQFSAEIMNADSRQVYRDLAILTARPGPAEERKIPHHLYGYLGPEEQTSVGEWLRCAAPIVARAADTGRPLIVVGGTGLYLKALVEGFPQMPDIPRSARRELEQDTRELSGAEVHALLAKEDPELAAKLQRNDRQRTLRGLEVIRATGQSLLYWQEKPKIQLSRPRRTLMFAVLPYRNLCAERIERRFRDMLSMGACDELAVLLKRYPDLLALPLARTTGAAELTGYLLGRSDLSTATEMAIIATRQYAKRQRTWFRHQATQFTVFEAMGEEVSTCVVSEIRTHAEPTL